MKIFNTYYPATTAATNFTTVPLDLGDLDRYSIQIEFTGVNVVGTLTLEIQDVSTLSWVTISESTQAVTASANHFYSVQNGEYRYVRLRWVYTSGSGNISAVAIIKENYVRMLGA